MNVQVVFEHHDYGQGYAESKVGLRIGELVQWYASTDYRNESVERYGLVRNELERVATAANAWKTGLGAALEGIE